MGRCVVYSDVVRGLVVSRVTHLFWEKTSDNALESNLLCESSEGTRLGNPRDMAFVRVKMMSE